MKQAWIRMVIALTATCLLRAATAHASESAALTREDLGAWLDGYVPYALQRGSVAGAVVVVVKDGAVLYKKGYGYADVATRRPFDADATMLRPGSVSKLMTWTAVMQLVEQGKIDLDGDVNAYLDFHIPPFHKQPISMRHLMTHTAGFAPVYADMIQPFPATAPVLGAYLRQHLPERIFSAGEVTAYSNYGAALAGYIVERISGQRFEDYIARHVFAPLQMAHSTFRQPPPPALQSAMSRAYQTADGPARPYEMIVAPAGAATVTGADMAHFMIAHLQEGTYQGSRILQARSVSMMHDSRYTTISPELNRILLGFYEFDRNRHRIIGHDGDSLWFHSRLQLYVDDHVGIFICMNSQGQDGAARALRQGLTDAFADRYFPSASPPARKGAATTAAAIAGRYYSSVSDPRTFLSLVNLFDQTEVTSDDAGRIRVSSFVGLNGQAKIFEAVAPMLWRESDGQGKLAATLVDGKVAMLGSDADPTLALLPVASTMNGAWLVPALVASIALLLLDAALWPLDRLGQRHYLPEAALSTRKDASARWARLWAVAAAGVMLSWLTMVSYMTLNLDMRSSLYPWLLALHLLSDLAFPLAAMLALWRAARVCARCPCRRHALRQLYSILLVVASGIMLWVAVAFHLVGFSVRF